MATILSALVVRPDPQVSLPSDEIRYDLIVNFKNGPQLVENVVPSDDRPDPDKLDTLSVAPNKMVMGLVESGIIFWLFNEQPDYAPCDDPGDGGDT